MSQLVSHDRAKIGAALMLLSPFVPLLFQGQEWAATSPFQYFVDYADEPDLAQAIAEGRRNEFGTFGWRPEDVPDPRAEETFLCSRLNWDERGSATACRDGRLVSEAHSPAARGERVHRRTDGPRRDRL